MKKISVIVPIYNEEKHLEECLDSILTQNLTDIEIILVDDGSTDASPNLIKKYQQSDSRIVAIHKENGGLSSARNTGLDIATGKYISFVDSDDWVEPNFLESMYDLAERNSSELVISNYNKIFSDKTLNNCLELADETFSLNKLGLDEYFYSYFFPYIHGHEAWNKLYLNEVIKKHSLRFEKNNIVFSEDQLFNLYYLCHIDTISSVNISLYQYRQHDDSIMHRNKPEITQRFMNLTSYYIRYIERQNLYKELENVLPILMYRLISRSLYIKYTESPSLRELKSELLSIADNPHFKSQSKKLAFTKAHTIYRKKDLSTLEAEIRARLFGLYSYLGWYSLAAKQKYKRYSKVF